MSAGSRPRAYAPGYDVSPLRGWPAQRGAVTVYFAIFTLMFFGLLVMATDFGRLYLIQGELQTAADAAALAAAMQLVGTTNATLHAGDQVTASFDSTTANDNRFNLRMNQMGEAGASGLLTTIAIDFFATLVDAQANVNGGQGGSLDWTTGVYPKYVRVQLTAQSPVLFVPLLGREDNTLPTIAVSAVAGISSPICTASGIDGLAVVGPDATDDIHYGFVPGEFYTLFLTPTQQTPNNPATPAPLAGTLASVQYVILDHIPSGPQGLDLDSSMFELGAGGIANAAELTPPGTISINATENPYPDLEGNTIAIGRDILCGLNTRFGIDPSLNVCNNESFVTLSALFRADSDLGVDEYAAGVGLQDFATEYDGSRRRILTMPVVDASDTLVVLNFRQFLIEPSANVEAGLDPTPVTGAFRAQYIGAPAPIRSSAIGGACTVTLGIGRVVLY